MSPSPEDLLALLLAIRCGFVEESDALSLARDGSGRPIPPGALLDRLAESGRLTPIDRHLIASLASRRLALADGRPSGELLAGGEAALIDRLSRPDLGPPRDRPAPTTRESPEFQTTAMDADSPDPCRVTVPETLAIDPTDAAPGAPGEPLVSETVAPDPNETILSNPGEDAWRCEGATLGERGTRYRLRQLKGQGGLGRVWVAHDIHLNREVALKELKSSHGGRPEALNRFLMEAQVTSQLEHPNIVPIHDLTHASGVEGPYYTMRLVRGETLQNRIRAYHESTGAGAPPERARLEMNRLLNGFVRVCEAIDYAHSRHVMHRDLKPENVVLGDFGEVYVLDWGLAKIRRDGDPEAEANSVDLSADIQLEETLDGRVMGTPAYMAPEQASGRSSEITARTDVFGLGTILFEILTGSAPHRGEGRTLKQLLEVVANEEPPTPRLRNAEVPRALDAICRRAMAMRPSDRYPSAQALAADVQLWLADEPVSAYREPRIQAAARWLRRHRTFAASAAGSLLVITLTAVLAFVVVNGARGREADARRLAVDRFQQARQALDVSVDSSRELARVLGTNRGGKRVLQEAARIYAGFADDPSADRALRAEAANASIRLAEIRLDLGDLDGAEAAASRAVTMFEALAAGGDRDPQERLGLLNARLQLGRVLAERPSDPRAEATLAEAVRELDAAATGPGQTPAVRERLAFARTSLANLLVREPARRAEAEALYLRAIADYGGLVRAPGVASASLVGRARALNNLAALLTGPDTAKEEAARGVDFYREAIRDLEALVARDPLQEYRERLATSLRNLALVLRDLGRLDEAAAAARSATEGFDALVFSSAGLESALGMVEARTIWANVLEDRDDRDRAIALYRDAVERGRLLVQLKPEDRTYRLTLAKGLFNHAMALFPQDTARGLAALDEAAGIEATLLKERSDDREAAAAYRSALTQRAQKLLDAGRPGDAARDAAAFAAIFPENAADQFNAACILARASGLLRSGPGANPAQADAHAAAAVARLREAVRIDPAGLGGGDLSDRDLDAIRARPDFPRREAAIPAAKP